MSATAILDAPPVKAWPQAKLADVADIVNGGTPKSNVAEFWDGEHQWLTPADMGKMVGREIGQTPRTITAMGLAKSSARLAPPKSVILSTRAPIGHLAINAVPMAFNQGCRALVPGPKLDHVFLYYFLLHSRELLNDLGTGTTFKELSATSLKTVQIPLPPLEEQKRIVAVLDQAFAALDRARALAEANLADAEELFDGWLTAVFHEHPAEWSSSKLRDLCHQITVGFVGPMADRYSSEGTPFLRSQNVRPFRIDLADVKFIGDAFRAELKKSELRPGDVAIVRTGYPGTAAVIPDDLPLANCADLVIARPKQVLHPEFLAMFLNSSFGKKMVSEKSVGAAQKHFNVGAAKEVDFAYPTLEEQRAIVSQMKAMRGYSTRLRDQCQAKIDELQRLRQALLQQAFAGELT